MIVRRLAEMHISAAEDIVLRYTTLHLLLKILSANVNSCSCSLYVVVRPSVCLSVCLSSVVCRL